MDYPEALPGKSVGDFLQFMLSAFPDKDELQAEDNRALWNPNINAGDEKHERTDQNAGKALVCFRREN